MAEPLSINIGRSAPLVFETPNQALEWIERELHQWSWLKPAKELQELGNIIGTTHDFVPKQLARVRGQINSWLTNPNVRNAVADGFRASFLTNRVPLSSDPISKLARQLLDTRGPQVAVSALAAHMGRIQFQNGQGVPFSVLEGLTAASALTANILSETPASVSSQLSQLLNDFEKKNADATVAWSEKKNTFDAVIEDAKQKLTAMEAETRSEWTEKIKESIAAVEATRAAYAEKMRLQASVSYWRQQSSEHAARANNYLNVLIVFSLLSLVGWIGAATKSIPALLEVPSDKVLQVYSLAAALSLLAATVTFWIARVLVRLYLGAQHQSIDASERVVMVQTFLALVNEDKLEPTDRTLVLTPLFRPSADGIVKDDAAPELSSAGFLSKLLDRK